MSRINSYTLKGTFMLSVVRDEKVFYMSEIGLKKTYNIQILFY